MRTRTVLNERLKRFVCLYRIRFRGLQVRLEDDQLEVPTKVVQPSMRMRPSLLFVWRLLRARPRLFYRVSKIEYLSTLVDRVVHGELDHWTLANHPEKI